MAKMGHPKMALKAKNEFLNGPKWEKMDRQGFKMTIKARIACLKVLKMPKWLKWETQKWL